MWMRREPAESQLVFLVYVAFSATRLRYIRADFAISVLFGRNPRAIFAIIALSLLYLSVMSIMVAQFPRFLRFVITVFPRFSFYCRGSGDISLWFSLHYSEITPRK